MPLGRSRSPHPDNERLFSIPRALSLTQPPKSSGAAAKAKKLAPPRGGPMICGWVFGCFGRDWHTPDLDEVPSSEPRDHQEIIPAATHNRTFHRPCVRSNTCVRIPGEGRGPVIEPKVPIGVGAFSASCDPASCSNLPANTGGCGHPFAAPGLGRGLTSLFMRSPDQPPAEAPPYEFPSMYGPHIRRALSAGVPTGHHDHQ